MKDRGRRNSAASGDFTTLEADRRRFIQCAAGLGAASLLPWPAFEVSAAARPGGFLWEIEAARFVQNYGDGSQLPVFRFFPRGDTPAAGFVPVLRTVERRRIRISVHNSLDFPIQPAIVEGEYGPVVPPGEMRTWRFRMPGAGAWLITEASLGLAGGPVGFAAILIADPKPASFTRIADRDSGFDRDYVLMYQDMDSRWNIALDAGDAPDTSIYEPNYHTLNGLVFPHTLDDPATRLNCAVGERVRIFCGNLGHVRQSVHFHGYHFDVMARNRVPETSLPEKDTVGLPGYTTAEIAWTVNQSGLYPIHPHSLTSVTDNGTYPAGQITLIDASA